MGRLLEIPRTAAFSWSSAISKPCIATGTRAGAVDADFSSETKLELWDLDLGGQGRDTETKPVTSLVTDSRFYDIAWSRPSSDHAEGIIAGALENSCLDLWDAATLKSNPTESLISRTQTHTGAIKALQFNPHRQELLASSGAKGELYVTDLNNAANPFRLGTAAARGDDIDALDWNKKVPHIMATAGSGGFVTVWDVKTKKESLTLNNFGRKPVSAVAWNPDLATKLATAVPSDQDPIILIWDLRNSSAPELVLRGHEQGVLSLSWCAQDSDLLLSCGKDNRNICWNPQTGVSVGEFPIVTNWTFQTRFNPQHPSILATASFDGKVAVQTMQNTNAQTDGSSTASTQAVDGADFFANVKTQPQTSSFSLNTPPKWLRRPVGASFGFGGKLVKFMPIDEQARKSKISISTVVSDESVETSITGFQTALEKEDLSQLCASKIDNAQSEGSKDDWKIIQTLVSDTPRKGLLTHLGFSDTDIKNEQKDQSTDGQANGISSPSDNAVNGTGSDKERRLSAFFDNDTTENTDFLADLAASKGGRTNNPFKIFTGSESDADKKITRALMLGSFEDALEICLKEQRMSEAFMIAICGGQKCIDKAQSAYFAQQSNGPNYLRLLASVMGKNLWDVVYNADLEDWSDVMATLCTYADEIEFPDLCEALGDRIEEQTSSSKDASFCYLAGSKLEKVVPIWINEMKEVERSRGKSAEDESAFSIHVQALQHFIEKVSIFRKATKYEDKDGQEKTSGWRLGPLYDVYAEYADIVAAYGHLELAQQYLNLLPAQYPAAEVARDRVKRATQKAASSARQPAVANSRSSIQTGYNTAPRSAAIPTPQPIMNPVAPTQAATSYQPPITGRYGPTAYQPQASPATSMYAPASAIGTSYQPMNQNIPPTMAPKAGPPPPSAGAASAARNKDGSNWNDLPETFAVKPTISRRGTPGVGAAAPSPYANQLGNFASPMPGPPPLGMPSRNVTPLAPPPRASDPPRTASPIVNQEPEQMQRVASNAASLYAPPPSAQNAPRVQPSVPRGASPYNPPPSSGPTASRTAPPSGRYTPLQSAQPAPGQMNAAVAPPPGARVVAPNPYASMSQVPAGPTRTPQAQFSQTPPPRPAPAAQPPPPQGPPRVAPSAPPPAAFNSRPNTAQSQGSTSAQYPAGDRTHISAELIPIYEIFNSEAQRVKARAPANYKAHVDDTEKRLNILFDQMNNQTIRPDTIEALKSIAQALQARNFEQAEAVLAQLMNQVEPSTPWKAGVKRLISMSKVTPV